MKNINHVYFLNKYIFEPYSNRIYLLSQKNENNKLSHIF